MRVLLCHNFNIHLYHSNICLQLYSTALDLVRTQQEIGVSVTDS